MSVKTIREAYVRRRTDRGTSLIELMISMVVLAVGLGAITILLTGAMSSNNKSSRDMTATLLAQMVMEQISAQHVYANGTITVTDCASTPWKVATATGPAGTGNGATLKSDGTIDFTQPYSDLSSIFYAMQYVDCSSSGGVRTTYEVRWNVMSVSNNTTSRLITTAARVLPTNDTQLGGPVFAFPITLRGIGAPGAGL
jgi:Tfp pilus assembly protein PilV